MTSFPAVGRLPDALSSTVTFSGCHAGRHEPTWAQQEGLMLQRSARFLERKGSHARFDGPLDEAAALPDVLRAIRLAVEHYDSLRTRYRSDADDGVVAIVAGDGQITVRVYEADGTEVSQMAAWVIEALSGESFGEDDLPLRAAVITDRGVPRRLVLYVHHLSADGAALSLLHERIRRLSADPRAGFPAAWQPREIAEFEASEAGRRQAHVADERLRGLWREIAALGPVARPGTGAPHGFVAATLRSRAVAAAADVLARRYATSVPSVITAGFAAALGRLIERDRYALLLAVGNRGRPELRCSVANLSQLVPAVVDVRPVDFREVCRSTALAALHAYRNGHHDPSRHRESITLAGLPLDPALPYLVNSRNDVAATPATTSPNQQTRRVRELQTQSAVEVLDLGEDPQYFSLGLSVFGADHLMMMGDRAAFSAAELGTLQNSLESVLVEAM